MYKIEETIGFVQKVFTLCEKGDIQMQVFVVSMVASKIIMGVFTTPRKAAACVEFIGRTFGEAAVYEFELNGAEENDPQDEGAAVRGKSTKRPETVSQKDKATHAKESV